MLCIITIVIIIIISSSSIIIIIATCMRVPRIKLRVSAWYKCL